MVSKFYVIVISVDIKYSYADLIKTMELWKNGYISPTTAKQKSKKNIVICYNNSWLYVRSFE